MIRRITLALAAGMVVGCCGAVASHAQTKRAFVVGVGDYKSLVDLQKTLADAEGYGQVFRDDLNFEVTVAPANATRAQFNREFGRFLETIRPGDEVAFVFSGHGWSDGLENYLALADAPRDASEFELKSETVPLSTQVLGQIRGRRPGLTLAIIDACRDNPFDNGAKAGFEKGLVRTEIAAGTLVVYAAGQRQKALDRLSDRDASRYSLFTRTLLPKLRDPAVPLMRSIDEAREEVQRLASSVKHEQRPAVYSDVSLNYCFAKQCAGAQPPLDPDTKLWVEISAGDPTCADYQRYRQSFPRGKFIARANAVLAQPPCTTAPAATIVSQPSATPTPGSAEGASTPVQTAAAVKAGEEFRDRLRDGSVGPQMVWLPAGSFKMGSPSGEAGRDDDEGPQRDVRISRPFAVGKFEVTWAEYDLCVAAKACPAAGGGEGWGKGARPVIYVSWNDAKAYATWLSQETGKTYRLLSEAEWEYAARAGTTTPFSTGANISTAQANYDGNYPYNGAAKGEYRQKTIPVGSFQANRFGLHDMHGNVWEWVEDCYEASYSAGQTSDGSAFTKSSCSGRVNRGGSWYDHALVLRSAVRSWNAPDYRGYDLGFRLARSS